MQPVVSNASEETPINSKEVLFMAKYNVTTNYGTKKGTNAADTFNVYGYENSVYGKGGKDIINVYGKENTVYGDSGADRITVFKGGNSWSSHTIYGGSGNDIFVVKKNKSIYAQAMISLPLTVDHR